MPHRYEVSPVRFDGQIVDEQGMSFQRKNRLTSCQVPNADGRISPSRDEALAIRSDDRPIYLPFVPREGADFGFKRTDPLNPAIRRGRERTGAVRMKSQGISVQFS